MRLYIIGQMLLLCLPVWCLGNDATPETRTLTVDGRARSYEWYVPDRDAGKPLPVILAFHGGGRPSVPGGPSLDHYADLTRQATKAGFVVVYPNGYQHSWNAGPGPDGNSPNWGPAFEKNVDDVHFIRSLLDDLAQHVSIDRHRIYATGMSNGAAMAYRLAIEMSQQIAAVAGIASEISLQDPVAVRPVPIMHFWGTNDPIERTGALPAAERTRRNIETWKRINGCSKQKETVKRGAAMRESYLGCKAPVILWTVEGMGHSWPGVSNGFLVRMALGPANSDISASAEMIDFFLRHPLP